MRYTESRMTDVAGLLLEGIDEDTVDFRPNYDGTQAGAGGSAGQLPEPAGQRHVGHRRRHGDQRPAAQCRRAVRSAAASHQAPERPHRQAGRDGAGARLPDRRHHRRIARVDPGGLQDRPRRLPPARALGARGNRPRHLPDHRHRNSLPGAEGQAGRAPGGADQREEGAAARRRARRVGGNRAAGAGAQEPRRRSGAADGEPVQAHRARAALLAQHERAVGGPGAGRAVAARCAAALARPPPGRAGAALQVPPAKDRASARGARRLSHRLSEHRRGDHGSSASRTIPRPSSSSASS